MAQANGLWTKPNKRNNRPELTSLLPACCRTGASSHKICDGHHIRHWSDGGEVYFVDQRDQRLQEFQSAPRIPIEESLAWMCRTFEHADVSAETPKARWHAGETMDLDYAVWVMCNACQRE